MQTVIEEDLPMQVDVVAWHPSNNQVIAVGAYQLSGDERIGRIYLLQLTPTVPGGFSVVLEHEPPGGVLDLKFSTQNSSTLLAVATSTGIFTFKLTLEKLELSPIVSLTTNVLVLYLEWMVDGKILFSDAEGCVSILENSSIIQKKKLHDALTWVCHYSNEQKILYAGCDDGKFTATFLKNLPRDEFHFVKKFDVGVTSIATKENIVLVGGYDDILKIYNLIPSNKPQLILKTMINLHGAVWRMQILPQINDSVVWTVAVAAARKGVVILEWDPNGGEVAIVKEINKYEGFLAYGLDVKVDKGSYLLAMGYYDNHVVWVVRV